MAKYKVEFLPQDLQISKGTLDSAVNIIETLINDKASQGWELDQIAEISITEKAGCLASMFGAKSFTVNYNLVVFKK
jgi:hypothetical protein